VVDHVQSVLLHHEVDDLADPALDVQLALDDLVVVRAALLAAETEKLGLATRHLVQIAAVLGSFALMHDHEYLCLDRSHCWQPLHRDVLLEIVQHSVEKAGCSHLYQQDDLDSAVRGLGLKRDLLVVLLQLQERQARWRQR